MAGVFGIFISLAFVFGWETFLTVVQNGMFNDANVQAVVSSFFETNNQKTLFTTGVLLTTITPAIGLLLLGVRLLFDFRRIPAWSGILLVVLWFGGVTLIAVSGSQIYQQFKVETTFTENVPLELPITDTLFIDLIPEHNTQYKFKSGITNRRFYFDDNVTFPGIQSTDILYIGENDFTVEMNSSDTIFKLLVKREAHGASQKDAVTNARNIESMIKVLSDSLLFHP